MRYAAGRWFVAATALVGSSGLLWARTAASATTAEGPENASRRDGQHDFDPLVGTWKAKLKRLVHPLSGSTTWIEFEGTQVTRSVWGGRATLDEFHVDSAVTNTHIDGLTLRLYNPESRQWHIYWANARKGILDLPPVVGEFNNGRGEFYDQEDFEGRSIFVRYVWSDITATSARFEQSFSEDGGKTWEPNWISTIERVKE
ncbi:MAG TPA: hypothetical protein VKI41_00775 [Vicinamibacteria bacterium]|nr:hypothetical protein [Vicinamibacteria bacterium]